MGEEMPEAAASGRPLGKQLGHRFARDSPEQELLRLAFPILGAIVVGLLDTSVNAMWVGRYLGDAALAAVSNANTLLLFLFNGISGICMALSIRTGFYIGAGHVEEAKRLVRATIWFLGIGGTLTPLLLGLVRDPILDAISVPSDARLAARQYLVVILLSVPLVYIYEMVVAVLRGAGDTKTAFYFSAIAVALDAGLNPVFIFGLGGMPRLGVAGSALATVIAQGTALGGLLGFLYWRRHYLCLSLRELAPRSGDWLSIQKLLKLGVPMGMEFLWYSVLALLLITLVNRFGSDMTAAYGAVVQLWAYVLMPSQAVVLAVISIAAQSLGAKREDRVRKFTRLGVVYSAGMTGILLLLLELMNRSALALFLSAGSPALTIAAHINHVASWSWVLYAGYSALLSAPRAAGAVWAPLALTVSAGGAQLLIAAVLLRFSGAEGIWWSWPISSAIAAVIAVRYYQGETWRPDRSRTATA